jgi:endonuclease/exonuclease/phosphatase family metal-dependent hydrolase
MTVFSCYWRPGTTLWEFASFLADLDHAIRVNDSAKLVVAGDFNAWNTEWGSRTNNPRGRLLSDLAASLGLLLANIGTVPTFVRGTATSLST